MKTEIKIEVDIPESYEFVRFGRVNQGDTLLNEDGTMEKWTLLAPTAWRHIIVRPIPEPLPLWTFPDWVKPSTWYCETEDGVGWLVAEEPLDKGVYRTWGWVTGYAASIHQLRGVGIDIPKYRLNPDWKASKQVKE